MEGKEGKERERRGRGEGLPKEDLYLGIFCPASCKKFGSANLLRREVRRSLRLGRKVARVVL